MPTFLDLLLAHDRYVVTTHTRPDGDALGSQIALGLFLERVGKHVSLIAADEPPANLEWLPHVDRAEPFTGKLDQLERIAAADAIVLVDTNTENRLARAGQTLRQADAEKFVIDHHPRPEKWFDHEYIREDASSTGELVYELIRAYENGADDRAGGSAEIIDADVAVLLYTAIMTDTGSFRYSNVNARVHRVIADLLDRGQFVPDDVHSALFDTKSLAALRLMGRALERINLMHDGRVGYLVLPRQMLSDAGADKGDTEGFVNHILSIDGVRVAVMFLETDKGTKVSFRSKGTYYVDRWASAFGGGGHRNASGAFVKNDLDAVVEDVLAAAMRYLPDAADRDPTLTDDDKSYLETLLKLK